MIFLLLLTEYQFKVVISHTGRLNHCGHDQSVIMWQIAFNIRQQENASVC